MEKRVIYKHELPDKPGTACVRLRGEYKIMKVSTQNGVPVMWTLEYPDSFEFYYHVYAIETGTVLESISKPIGTVELFNGDYILHYFIL